MKNGFEESMGLRGAVSPYTVIPTIGSEGHDAVVGSEDLYCLVNKDNFYHDHENDIFVNENGAVADAYIIHGENEEIGKKVLEILFEKKAEYPDYEFKLVCGEFPIDVLGVWKTKTIYSTHVLYISNYKEYLTKETKKQDKLK